MTNDEWEIFKKQVNPIKPLNKIENSSIKNSLRGSKHSKVETDEKSNYIDLEDNPAKVLQIDKNTIKKIKKGKINVSTYLDLHGHTIKESKEKVVNFIKKNFFLNNRLVLIITGKGKNFSINDGLKNEGKLKKSVPIWLSSTYLSKYILWFDVATPDKGGSGALFVYLKKTKE